MGYTVRQAIPEDSAAIVEVLRRSIAEVCGPDYQNSPEIISNWLANKTVENIEKWMLALDNRMIVGVSSDTGCVCGIGLAQMPHENGSAKLLLCYLLPEALGKGIGSSILSTLEMFVRENGARKMVLQSTRTAMNFYLRHGYRALRLDRSQPIGIEMEKLLV